MILIEPDLSYLQQNFATLSFVSVREKKILNVCILLWFRYFIQCLHVFSFLGAVFTRQEKWHFLKNKQTTDTELHCMQVHFIFFIFMNVAQSFVVEYIKKCIISIRLWTRSTDNL